MADTRRSRQKSVVSMKIYDAGGRLVRQFDYPTIRQSDHVVWNGTDINGQSLSQGIYFVQLKNKTETLTEKVVLMK